MGTSRYGSYEFTTVATTFSGLKADTDYESVTVSWNQMPQAIIEGSVDAVLVPAMFPGPRVTRVARW